jgi:hypothetical protein
MARALQKIMMRQHKKVDYRENKSAFLMVFANDKHDAIAQLIVAWMSATPAVAIHNKLNDKL